jgi:phenylacetic acid degradation operon negative regulatory protein
MHRARPPEGDLASMSGVAAGRASPNARALVLELFGGFIRRLGGWVAVATLVHLLDDLGVDERTTRAAASRMRQTGLLERAQGPGGAVGYCLTPRAAAILEEGDRRIFQVRQPTELRDGWVLVVFSIPETRRDLRHALRSRLLRLGFGNAAPGVWLAPRWQVDELRSWVERLGVAAYVDVFEAHYRGSAAVERLVRRCWDLGALRARYVAFIEAQAPVLTRRLLDRDGACADPHTAFVEYTLALSAWRRLPYPDPGLPAELLPPDWEGFRAAELFFRLRERLEGSAFDYVRELTAG